MIFPLTPRGISDWVYMCEDMGRESPHRHEKICCTTFLYCSSCLSEYILVEFGGKKWKLCHSNVTTPILIGNHEDSGYFDSTGHVTILVKWVGVLDIRTSYLGRYVVVGYHKY
jgi:hypothetical protein